MAAISRSKHTSGFGANGMYDIQTEHLFSYSAQLAPPEIIGSTIAGIRANFYVTGGDVDGPHVRGRVKPVGGDFFCMRADGVGVLDVRLVLETSDGALIAMSYPGLGDLGADGYAKFASGDLPARVALRTTPKFLTSHPAYEWLQRHVCVGVGEIDMATLRVNYDVYAVR
jgi:Protein of unknown function (DUF3237)